MRITFKHQTITKDQLWEYAENQECITIEDCGLCEGGYYIIPYFPEHVSEMDKDGFEQGLL